jgi:hypothetical protein
MRGFRDPERAQQLFHGRYGISVFRQIANVRISMRFQASLGEPSPGKNMAPGSLLFRHCAPYDDRKCTTQQRRCQVDLSVA